MDWLKYLISFVGSFIFIYIVYFLFVAHPYIRSIRMKEKNKKVKKERKYPTEVSLLRGFYKINIDKIGIIRVLRILNFVDAFVLALLITAVIPIKQDWLKITIIAVLIMPTIWFMYYYLAKYLKHLERKSENV